MASIESPHIPVMPTESLHWLAVKPHGTYLDCTAGAGGHSQLIAQALETGRLIALDRDKTAVELTRKRLAHFDCVQVHHANYGTLTQTLKTIEVNQLDGILLDAGCSSMQLDQGERGFSFQSEGPLDMRMDTDEGETARDFLMRVSEGELATILRDFGDIGPVKRIAAAIKKRANAQKLEYTPDLVAAVEDAFPTLSRTPDEVRTVFQAVRMAVNQELRWLTHGLEQGIDALAPQGRLVVISFHSGEDRVMKRVLREASRVKRTHQPDGRVASEEPAKVKLLTRKPILPGEEEIMRNPRAKSAKLRVIERI